MRIKDTRHWTLDTRQKAGIDRRLQVPGAKWLASLVLLSVLCGCATTKPVPVGSDASVDQKFQAVAVDIYKNEESRTAAQKILGVTDDKPVIKYSPVTGKHYSGDLEFDPETGAKLEVIKE